MTRKVTVLVSLRLLEGGGYLAEKGKGNKKAAREGAKTGVTAGMGAGLCLQSAHLVCPRPSVGSLEYGGMHCNPSRRKQGNQKIEVILCCLLSLRAA